MAALTRYFSTSSAGTGDGTSWANRAQLVSGSTWSSVITGANYATDSMLAFVGPGTYTPTSALANTSFSVAIPTGSKSLVISACDSSGNPLNPPDNDWTAARTSWDDSNLPIISLSTNISAFTSSFTNLNLLKIIGTGSTTNALVSSTTIAADWCIIEQRSSNASANAIANIASIRNSVVRNTQSTTGAGMAASISLVCNVRMEGNGGGVGYRSTATNCYVDRLFVTGYRTGLQIASTNAAAFGIISRTICINNTQDGILLPSTASQSQCSRFSGLICINNGRYGINAQSAANMILLNSRFRDNTSGNFNGILNANTSTCEIGTGTNTDEFVNYSSGDYRIRYGSSSWGKGYGIEQQNPVFDFSSISIG